jgi:membrane protein
MLYAGVRWVGALRRSLTVLSGQLPRSVPYLRGLVRDIVTLSLLGAAVLASVGFTIVGELASGVLDQWLGTGAAAATLRVVTLVAALGTDFAIGWVLYHDVPGKPLRGTRLLVVAVVAGLGFEVLKQLGGLIIAAGSKNVVYGTFAATVGVLVWISYGCRWILFVGAWALVDVTSPEAGGSVEESEPGGAAGSGREPAGDAPALPAAAQGHHADPDGEGTGDAGHHPQREGQR